MVQEWNLVTLMKHLVHCLIGKKQPKKGAITTDGNPNFIHIYVNIEQW
jgi:hypothetical protein